MRRIHKEFERVSSNTYCALLAGISKGLLVAGLLLATAAGAQDRGQDTGPLLRILDGDTYEMLLEGFPTKVRLFNADTPETGRRAQCAEERELGDRATNWVREAVATRDVAVFPVGRPDKYGRQLVHVRIDGEDLARLLVNEGLARFYYGERRRGRGVEKKQVRRPVSRVLSPPVRAMDGHSSGMPVTGHLARPTRATSRKHRCRLPGVPPLFGLAPGGVCHAASVAGRAVGSYPTVSPLPGQQAGPAVCSLWHFP